MTKFSMIASDMLGNAKAYEAFGFINTLRNFAAAGGLDIRTLRYRLKKGASLEEALMRPLGTGVGRPRGRSKLSSRRRGPAGGGARKSASNSGFSE